MINIWEYEDSEQLRITDIDGKEWLGKVVCFTDTEERTDLEPQEDGISIATPDGQFVELLASEITAIEDVTQQTLKTA